MSTVDKHYTGSYKRAIWDKLHLPPVYLLEIRKFVFVCKAVVEGDFSAVIILLYRRYRRPKCIAIIEVLI